MGENDMRTHAITMESDTGYHLDFNYTSEDPHLLRVQAFKEISDGKLECTSITINVKDARALREFLYSFENDFQRRNGHDDI
jgi:hypothetical protein